MKKMSIGLALGLSVNLSASTVAIIDSGTDLKHTELVQQAWLNPVDSTINLRDEDQNGYEDDVNGWNFAEDNKDIIDYSYLGLLNDDIKKFFTIQMKAMIGTANPSDINWLKAKIQDKKFVKRLQVYGNFMHGTHVAHIAARLNADNAKVFAVKLIPTEVKIPSSSKLHQLLSEGVSKKSGAVNPELANLNDDLKRELLKQALTKLSVRQMKVLTEIARYVSLQKADIANGSFGTGYSDASRLIGGFYKGVFGKDPSASDLKILTDHFMSSLLSEGSKMVSKAPKTLFVFAAGNSKSDNDAFPTSPTNINADNVISVAATYKNLALAPFSNYGSKTVDVAAPGLGITAAVPGDQYLTISGTSQAAPYVAGIASKMKDINNALTPKGIKTILMGTVSQKSFLLNKVKSGGLVNAERAYLASELSMVKSISEAIKEANEVIVDKGIEKSSAGLFYMKGLVPSLPGQFVLP